MADYIPQKDSELVAWSANFTEQVAANAEAWEIPAADVAALQTANTAFAALHAKADSPAKNTIIVSEKNAARKTLVEKIRALADFRLKNPVITDTQRVAMGLHVRDTTPTTIDVPKTHPDLTLEAADSRSVKGKFHDHGSANNARPYGTNGAVIIFAVLATPPAGTDDLIHSVLATRTPHIFNFSEEERGKTVYAAACWQNEKGQKGPWSDIVKAIIP